MWAVLWTDLVQLVIKMTAVIVARVLRREGGRRHRRAEDGARRSTSAPSTAAHLRRCPPAGSAWMPADRAPHVPRACSGGRPGIPAPSRAAAATSRSASSRAKTERDGVLATLWFTIAPLRAPAVAVDPDRARAPCSSTPAPRERKPERGRVREGDGRPHARRLEGLHAAGFAAAYMSTVATQLNWGASYLVDDVYMRFLRRTRARSTTSRSRGGRRCCSSWRPSS